MSEKKKSYWEMLQDPRWQRKRLEIMEAAEFTCVMCDSKEKTLTVHHSYYEKDREPWDYPAKSLWCVCDDCHKKAQALYNATKEAFGYLDYYDTCQVLAYMTGLRFSCSHGSLKALYIPDRPAATGVANAWEVYDEDVISALGKDSHVSFSRLEELRKAVWEARRKAIRDASGRSNVSPPIVRPAPLPEFGISA